MKIIQRIFNNLRLGFYYLIQSLISGDKVLTNTTKEEVTPGSGIEQQQEQQSVYKDLLRGEVTQEVKELRHQMYFVERKSHEYEYSGGGLAKKKNTLFDYQGVVENSDNLKIKLVQENKPITKSLDEEGVHLDNENVIVDKKVADEYKVDSKIITEYLIHCEREFFSRFRLEQYTTKVVVKEAAEGYDVVDFYVSQYAQQFNRNARMFLAEVDRVYQGDMRSDIVKISKIWFTTHNAYGADDMLLFAYENPRFDNILKFEGSYVFRFYCKIAVNGDDGIQQYYNKEMAEKYENHEVRENATIDFEAAEAIKRRSEIDLTDELELLKEVK